MTRHLNHQTLEKCCIARVVPPSSIQITINIIYCKQETFEKYTPATNDACCEEQRKKCAKTEIVIDIYY